LTWLAGAPLPWLAEQAAGVRHSPQIAGLAVPALLALAAVGVDRLLGTAWPRLQFALASRGGLSRAISLDPRWLLALLLGFALVDARAFSSRWISMLHSPDTAPLLEQLRTADLQWVNPPFGAHFWIEAAVGMGVKLNFGIRTGQWRDRPQREPVLEANRASAPPGMTEWGAADGVPIYAAGPGREYAAVTQGDGRTVCTAQGSGGSLDVSCDAPAGGT